MNGAVNETMTRFGHPSTLVKEYAHWVVLVRTAQVTLGSLVLACREPATAFSDISTAAFDELQTAIGGIERTLSSRWSYKKINYLMLMMVDPHVHFHVIPRYDRNQDFNGQEFADTGWPKAPDLANAVTLDQDQSDALVRHLREHWQD